MKSIFICTHINDAHAMLVQVALEAAGHRVVRWIGADCPTRQTQSLRIIPSPSIVFKTDKGEYSSNEFDVIWWRRLTPAFLPRNVHPGDAEAANREWEIMYESLSNVFKKEAMWVNSFEGRRLGNDKIRQLACARDVGLKVPDTLVSNNIDDIRSFVANQSSNVVHKMFAPTSWANEERYARARTTIVTSDHLLHEASLKLCPGIFQARVSKKVEIRATFMGNKCNAVEIEPRDEEGGVCDWRSIPAEHWRMQPTTLPDDIHRKCLQIMDRLKIVFGCFDLILTTEGEYVFLEVNQMGQFLWVEESCHEMKLLSDFCNFIIAGTTQNGHSSNIKTSMADVSLSERYAELKALESDAHVNIKPYLLDNAY